MRIWLAFIATLLSAPAFADTPDIRTIVESHVLPGYRALVEEATDLVETATTDCNPANPALRAAYQHAFDAWMGVSHLRFGPSERDDRAFALAFWPDSRGSTPKALTALITNHDQVVSSQESFATVSVAARGFYALDYLLYDEDFAVNDDTGYICALIEAVSLDILAIATAILDDWENGYGDLIANSGNETYRTEIEAAQQFLTVLLSGLEFTSETRLGRPMGTLDQPRPNRAEARRSERPLRNVVLSLEATRKLASLLSENDASVDRAFQNAIEQASSLDDPLFAGVSEPRGRFRVEVLQQRIDDIRRILSEEVGPRIGIAAGFNSMDGD